MEISETTLGDALTALYALCPGVRDRIANEQGQIREHVSIFVGEENMRYTGGLATPINSPIEIHIVPAVSGGAPRIPSSRRGCRKWALGLDRLLAFFFGGSVVGGVNFN